MMKTFLVAGLVAGTFAATLDGTSTIACDQTVVQVGTTLGGNCKATPKLGGNPVLNAAFTDFGITFDGGNITGINGAGTGPDYFTFQLVAGATSGEFTLGNKLQVKSSTISVFAIASTKSMMNCSVSKADITCTVDPKDDNGKAIFARASDFSMTGTLVRSANSGTVAWKAMSPVMGTQFTVMGSMPKSGEYNLLNGKSPDALKAYLLATPDATSEFICNNGEVYATANSSLSCELRPKVQGVEVLADSKFWNLTAKAYGGFGVNGNPVIGTVKVQKAADNYPKGATYDYSFKVDLLLSAGWTGQMNLDMGIPGVSDPACNELPLTKYNNWGPWTELDCHSDASGNSPYKFGFTSANVTDCKSVCSTSLDCAQAVYDNNTKVCSAYTMAGTMDADGMKGNNTGFTTVLCGLKAATGRPQFFVIDDADGTSALTCQGSTVAREGTQELYCKTSFKKASRAIFARSGALSLNAVDKPSTGLNISNLGEFSKLSTAYGSSAQYYFKSKKGVPPSVTTMTLLDGKSGAGLDIQLVAAVPTPATKTPTNVPTAAPSAPTAAPAPTAPKPTAASGPTAAPKPTAASGPTAAPKPTAASGPTAAPAPTNAATKTPTAGPVTRNPTRPGETHAPTKSPIAAPTNKPVTPTAVAPTPDKISSAKALETGMAAVVVLTSLIAAVGF